MNGAIVKWGEKYGVPTRTIGAMVGADEGAGARWSGENHSCQLSALVPAKDEKVAVNSLISYS